MGENMGSQITLKEHGLNVPLDNGETAYFNYYWLRDNCPTSFDPVTRERSFDVFSLANEPKPDTAQLMDGALEIIWQADGHKTRHALGFLSNYTKADSRSDPADLQRKPWYGDHYSAIQRFSQPELIKDQGLVEKWAEALLVEGIAIVTDMPPNERSLGETAKHLGYIRPTFFGDYFDVKTHVNPTNLAFTAAALEMHTDVPAEDFAPGIQYLHCLVNSVEGGNSIFLDGVAVANDFRKSNPADFKLLCQTEIPFYCEHDSFDMRARQKVIELDKHGEVSGLTVSGHLGDVFDQQQTFLDEYYPAYCRFGRMLSDDKYVMHFRLNAGECIVFDNHRILHGREGYTASSGERHLRGCYTDRGELRSTYRTLKKETNPK